MSKRAPDLPAEIEAKLTARDPRQLRRIAALPQVAGYRLVARTALRLRSTYFDTADLALTRHQAVLRLRRAADAWEMTAKCDSRVRDGVHQRTEITVALDAQSRGKLSSVTSLLALTPPGESAHSSRRSSQSAKDPGAAGDAEKKLQAHALKPIHDCLAAILAGRPLQPVLITDIRRQPIDVYRDEGEAEPLAEIDLDRVRLSAPDAAMSGRGVAAPGAVYFEIEIEQRAGKRKDVQRLARALKQQFALEAAPLSKFERGFRLIYGADLSAPRNLEIVAADSTAGAVGKLVDIQLRRLRRLDPQVRRDVDPEGLHDFRVAVRRLRALLRLFPDAIAKGKAAVLRRELRWLGTQLGAVRDLDVQIARLQRATAAAPPGLRSSLAGFLAHLRAQRAARFPELIAVLDSARYFALLLQLEKAAVAAARRLRRVDTAVALFGRTGRAALRAGFKRLRRRGDRIRHLPAPEDLHDLRIRAKRTRYLLEFLRDLTGKPGRRLVRKLVRLQDLLGDYHDAIVAADAVRAYVESGGGSQPATQLMALGALVAQHLQRAEALRLQFDSAWSRFVRARNLRLLDDVLRRLDKTPRNLHEASTARLASHSGLLMNRSPLPPTVSTASMGPAEHEMAGQGESPGFRPVMLRAIRKKGRT